MSHSVLSASASHRWLNCTPSIKFCADMPDSTSVFAEEGTRAHELCAYKLAQMVKRKGVDKPGYEYDAATEDCADGYVSFVMEHVRESSVVLIEHRVDYSEFVGAPAFGTADCVVLDDRVLTIIDYKHGMGVPVDAVENTQLMLYALGAYSGFSDMYDDIETVKVCIYQPRISNVSEWSISLKELLDRAENYFKPRALMALKGEGEFQCGEWCRFCRGKAVCRARAQSQLATARDDFALPPKLSDDDVAELLPKLEGLIRWCEDIQSYALEAALNGTQFKGYKLVYGRSVRRFSDEEKVAQIVEGAGKDPWEKKLLGITTMEKLLGKKEFASLLGDLVIKPQGKQTLVPESDKRPAVAISDFVNK